MRKVHSFRYPLCAWALVAVLAGCNGGGPSGSTFAPAGLASRAVLTTALGAPARHADHGRSWLSPELKKAQKVLFVTDESSSDVYLFKLPSLKHVGTITGFNFPQGACSDNKGNVWIANQGAANVLEYSHQGELENTLTDSTGVPEGCAWDPTTGNLAVTNFYDFGTNQPGAVLIYHHASGSPTAYRNPDVVNYVFAGYDGNGNLFFDGISTSAFVLSELPEGAAKAHTLEIIGGTLELPGMVEWYSAGNYLLVGDRSCGGCVYRLSVARKTATIEGEIKLKTYTGQPLCQLFQGTQAGAKLYGSDNENGCALTPSTAYAWPFPAGKNPSEYDNAFLSEPIGAALSK